MRVQIAAAHEARLRRVGMDPAQHHQILAVGVLEQFVFVDGLAGIRGAGLIGDDEFGDEERIGDEGAAEDAAGFEIGAGVGFGEGEEAVAEVGGEEERAQWRAVFEVGRGFEGEG